MKHLDAGASGAAPPSQPIVTWADLKLPAPWPAIIGLLAPNTQPRPVQLAALQTYQLLASRRNLIVSAPTNSGKSLVGHLVLLDAIRQGQRAVLLVPLRALAREKADELSALAPALAALLGRPFTVTISTGDYRLEEEWLAAPPPNRGELIIATPERLEAIFRNPAYTPWLTSISAICVDEAHLIASPHRGPTLEHLLTAFLCLPAPPRIIFLSATLGDTARAQNWLAPCDLLRVDERHPPLHKQVLALTDAEDATQVVLDCASAILTEPTANLLLFVYQTRSAEALAGKLAQTLAPVNITALAYHAQMSAHERQQVQQAFRTGACRCLVTTTALGLGVNLPATHVIVRDNTFSGVGRLAVSELLQMMGRAGRGNQPGYATVIVRPTDGWPADELAQALRHETVAPFTSAFDQIAAHGRFSASPDHALTTAMATRVAAYLARQPDTGASLATLQAFFQRSLGGQTVTAHLPAALHWLTDPMRVLAYQDDQARYRLTVLGQKATHATLPLPIASGIAQLIRDLLTIDPSDRLLASWRSLDSLLVLTLLHDRTLALRPFSGALAEQIDSWLERTPDHASLLYREWLRGAPGYSRAEELFGSLGLTPPTKPKESQIWAQRTAYQALLASLLLYERGQGRSVADLTGQWRVQNLEGIEERWRDDLLWLLAGFSKILDIRCFFYHLKQECAASPERIYQLKPILRHMTNQLYQLQDQLKYCSPLGSLLYSIRHSQPNPGRATIGIGTIRHLEQAGITTAQQLATMTVEALVQQGIRRDFARQIHLYLKRRQL